MWAKVDWNNENYSRKKFDIRKAATISPEDEGELHYDKKGRTNEILYYDKIENFMPNSRKTVQQENFFIISSTSS